MLDRAPIVLVEQPSFFFKFSLAFAFFSAILSFSSESLDDDMSELTRLSLDLDR